MSRSSQSRGEYPLVGLVAAVAVVAGVSGYVALVGSVGPASDRAERVAEATLVRAHEAVTSGGVAIPSRLAEADPAPDGWQVRLRLAAAGRVWRAGPSPPGGETNATLDDSLSTEDGSTLGDDSDSAGRGRGTDTASATEQLGVQLGPGRIRPGTLTVEVWR